jgi:hypothetical protein
VSVAITSVNPTFATPRAKVTVSGTVTNATAAPAAGLTVQLYSSSVSLGSREAMGSYLTAPPGTAVDSPATSLLPLASVPAHTTRSWSLTLQVKQVGMTKFGVYPLAAQLYQFGTAVDAARTFLPFWPGRSQSRTLKPVTLAWIWPLIDVPHQAACPALLNDSLAASLAGGGRLNQLLAVGSSALARSAGLTWAIDPALLNDAAVMTARYRVGGTATCSNGSTRPASVAAQAWLAGVRSVAAQQDFFVTPYADVDVAALAHRGLNTELADAFADGRSVAQAVLRRPPQRPPAALDGGRTGAGATGLIAWPAGGIADYGVLESLAAPPTRIGTVILDSTMMRPTVSFTPTAVTTTPDGVYGQMHVLLADNGIEQVLAAPPGSLPGTAPGTGGARSSPAAAAFAREQWFLAETAMIAAQAPHTARAVVVAPPRRWNPGAGLAHALLKETVDTPWLHPASLSSLVGAKRPSPAQREDPPSHQVSRNELNASLLRRVQRLDRQIGLLASILVQPGPRYLSKAVDTVESSAWSNGPGGRRMARQLLRRLTAFVAGRQQQVSIVDPLRVTLGGKSGEVPVSISNHLGQAVNVRLQVGPSTGRVVIGNFTHLVTVAGGGTQRTIKIPVRAAAAGATTLTLWLTTPDGRPLPGSTAKLTVEATHFGTMAIVIIGIALGVFVLTAAGRAIWRGRGRAGEDGNGAGQAAEAGLTGPDPAYAGPEADNVEPEQAGQSSSAKEPDEHASTPGWAERH